MPDHRNVYISLAASMSKTGKFQLTPLVQLFTLLLWPIFVEYMTNLIIDIIENTRASRLHLFKYA